MTKQIQIVNQCDLLDSKGLLTAPGYATRPVWKYNRDKIKAPWYRIKEWDYYAVLCQDQGFGITFTMSDLGYIGMYAICWLDFNQKTFTQLDQLTILPRGKTGFPADSDSGQISFSHKKFNLNFQVKGDHRLISVDAPEFQGPNGERGLSGEIELIQKPDVDSMVIASSWEENPRAFYYNRKINCMPASGQIKLGQNSYSFTPANSFGTLDWGRGNWTYKNRWYWGSASGIVDDKPFGWNIGYGFSDRSNASENMLFFDNKAHKLSEVTFHFDDRDFMKPWSFSSDDGRFEMDFQPVVDRSGATNLFLIKSVQHQVFGYFNGYVILDNNSRLEIKNFLGFAEDVLNWW